MPDLSPRTIGHACLLDTSDAWRWTHMRRVELSDAQLDVCELFLGLCFIPLRRSLSHSLVVMTLIFPQHQEKPQ